MLSVETLAYHELDCSINYMFRQPLYAFINNGMCYGGMGTECVWRLTPVSLEPLVFN